MSKSKGKMKAAPAPKKRRATGAERKARKNVAKHSTILFWFTAILLLGLFLGRWVTAIANGYTVSFTELDTAASQAVGNMKDLRLTDGEREELLPLQKEWDLFSSARLRDEVTMTASDGAELHGYLYNENAGVTVVVLPRFYQDGTADFLPAMSLYDLTGCNLLLLYLRAHGEKRPGGLAGLGGADPGAPDLYPLGGGHRRQHHSDGGGGFPAAGERGLRGGGEPLRLPPRDGEKQPVEVVQRAHGALFGRHRAEDRLPGGLPGKGYRPARPPGG